MPRRSFFFSLPGWGLLALSAGALALTLILVSSDRRRVGSPEPIALQPALPLDRVVTDPERHAGRRVVVRGSYDIEQSVFVSGATFRGQIGARVYTPMQIAGAEGDLIVLVDRGWIPEDEIESFVDGDGARGEREIYGTVQPYVFAGPPRETPGVPQRRWQSLRPDALQQELPYTLLPLILSREAGSGVELPLVDVGAGPPRPSGRLAAPLWTGALALALALAALAHRYRGGTR